MVCCEFKNGNAYLVFLFASAVVLEESHSGWNWVSLLQIVHADSRKKKELLPCYIQWISKTPHAGFYLCFSGFLWIDKPQTSAKTSSKLKCFIFPGCGVNRIKNTIRGIIEHLAQTNPGFGWSVSTVIATAIIVCYITPFSLPASQSSQRPRALTVILWAHSETCCKLLLLGSTEWR